MSSCWNLEAAHRETEKAVSTVFAVFHYDVLEDGSDLAHGRLPRSLLDSPEEPRLRDDGSESTRLGG